MKLLLEGLWRNEPLDLVVKSYVGLLALFLCSVKIMDIRQSATTVTREL
jgi:hypothetical protein